MLTPREKSPLPENVPRGVSNPRHFGSEPKHYQLSYSGPRIAHLNAIILLLYLIQLKYTDTRPTSPSTDPVTQGAWLGSYRSPALKLTNRTARKSTQVYGSAFIQRTLWPIQQLADQLLYLSIFSPVSSLVDRLVGQVVKASASRAEGPGFESR